MKYSEARLGRVFILRLEHGEVLNETIEKFAKARRIKAGLAFVVGGVDRKSRFVVGPRDGEARPVSPMQRLLRQAHEVVGFGTLFRDHDTGKPVLHMHAAAGRSGKALAGCTRNGVIVWQIAEVALLELRGTEAKRKLDRRLGFKLLSV